MSSWNVQYILNLKDRMSAQLKSVMGQTGKLDGAMKGLADNVLFQGGMAASAMLLVNKIKDVTVEFQRLQTVLNVAFGSEAAAGAAFSRIQEFAAKTPFSVGELTDSFVKLKNRGFDPTNEELTKMGDLAASQGKDFGMLTEAILDAQSGEFERLKEFGIKSSKEGNKVTLSFKGVTQEVDNTNEAITRAILNMGAFEGVAGGMEAQSKTLGGQLSNLGDSFDRLLFAAGDLATGGGEGSGGVVGFISKQMDNFGNIISNYGKIWKDVDADPLEKIGETAKNSFEWIAGGIGTIANLGEMVGIGEGYDVSPYISSHDAMIARIDSARNLFRGLNEEQQAFYNQTLNQEQYNKLLERNAQLMGMTVDKFKEYIGLTKQVAETTGPAATSVEGLEKQIKQYRDQQKEATSREEFMKSEKEISKLQSQLGKITGKPTGGGARAGGAGAGATSSTLTSRSPQTFNINITKLVETINTTKPQLNTTDSQTMRQITEALVMAVNDVQTTVQ